jgi:hypothetical protein
VRLAQPAPRNPTQAQLDPAAAQPEPRQETD